MVWKELHLFTLIFGSHHGAQASLLEGLGEPYGLLGIKSWSNACKAGAPPTVLSQASLNRTTVLFLGYVLLTYVSLSSIKADATKPGLCSPGEHRPGIHQVLGSVPGTK